MGQGLSLTVHLSHHPTHILTEGSLEEEDEVVSLQDQEGYGVAEEVLILILTGDAVVVVPEGVEGVSLLHPYLHEFISPPFIPFYLIPDTTYFPWAY